MNDYSSSLFLLGKEENLLDVFYEELKSLIEVFKDKDFSEFFNNKLIKTSEKKEVINKHFKDIHKYIFNFLNILVDEKKEDELMDIFNSFVELYFNEKGIVKGLVYGLEIDNDKIKKLEEIFSDKLDKKVILEFKQDISLLGGYKVLVDNKLYDNSYKNKLNKLRDKLLEEGEFDD